MSVDEAYDFFAKVPKIEAKLKTLKDVGLGYITLGQKPIILVGGPTDKELAHRLVDRFAGKELYSACGNFNLSQSASIVKQSAVLLTNDTGMMHIASCFEIPTVSVWRNTVPELGMYPYFPKGKENSCKIFSTQNEGNTWTEPTEVQIPNPDSAILGHPSTLQTRKWTYRV